MDNTEGTPQPGDSVETTRDATTSWSNLAEDYLRLGSILAVAAEYGRSYKAVRNELIRQKIQMKPRGHVKGQKKSQAWRDASARHWNDPEWREQQRRQWLERVPPSRGWQVTDSPLERLLQEALVTARVSFSTQEYLHQPDNIAKGYVVDIMIIQKPVVIEADGGSNHLLKKEHDLRREIELEEAGYRVFRFTGTEIYADSAGCISKVITEADLIPEENPVFTIRDNITSNRMRKLWADPEQREVLKARLKAGRWPGR